MKYKSAELRPICLIISKAMNKKVGRITVLKLYKVMAILVLM
jgi:hypothetical protein